MAKKPTRPRPGQPPKLERIEDLTMEMICDIMVRSARKGSFFCNLPAKIHEETDCVVSMSWLEKQQDEEFLRSKSLAFAYCSQYWDEQMHLSGVPSAAWIFIKKNVSGWVDRKEVTAQVNQTITDNSEDKAKAKLDEIKKMVGDR